MAYDKVANGLTYFKSKLPFLDKSSRIILRSDKTYIVPSGFGFAFSLLAIILLILAINSANNLIYFFAFLLISIALTGMLITNQNIEAIQVKDIHSVHVFAREKNQLPVCLRNSQGLRDSWNIGLQIMTNSTFEESYAPSVKALEELRVLVPWTPVFRGLQKIPRLKIQSRFPFGMLRAWKYYEVTASVTVFPERKGQLDLPASTGGIDQDETKFETDTKGYFRDFRLYQKTDNPNRIDWKRSLKHQKHLVKNYEAEAAGEKKVLIDWDLTANLQNFEDRISQLALWIDEAQRKHEFYSLKISNMQTGYELSLNHYKHCMQILALLQPKDII